MVVSQSSGESACVDLLIEPRNGFTRKLFDSAEDYQKDQQGSRVELPFGFSRRHAGNPKPSDYRSVILSGPHGATYPVCDYAKVLMFAEGFGIAAVLQFLHKARTRHIYLFWQLQHLGKLCSTPAS